MNTTTITVEIRMLNGDYMLDSQAMSLLFGVDLEAVNALPAKNGASPIPREWARRGRRRASEARAHTGSDDLIDTMTFWAQEDYGSTLEVVVLDEPDA